MKASIYRQLIILVLLIPTICKAQETYWAANEVARISRKEIHGVTLAYMESIAEERLHVVMSGDSIEFHYPFQKKMKASEVRTVSNFKIFDDYDKPLDSVYFVGLEKGSLVIKFYYLGSPNKDNEFEIKFEQLNRQQYFEEIEELKKNPKKDDSD